MPSPKTFTHLPTTSVTVTGHQLASRWKKQAKRRSRSSGEPNYPRMLCQTVKLVIASRKRLLKMAPLLFEREAIEREVYKRLAALTEWLRQQVEFRKTHGMPSPESAKWEFLADAADPLEAAKAKFRSEIAEETWKSLSPNKLELLKVEWKLNTLATAVVLNAIDDSKLHSNPDHIRLSHICTLYEGWVEWGHLLLRWTVPPQLFDIEDAVAMEACATDKPVIPGCSVEETPSTPAAQRKAAKYADNIIRLSNYLSATDGTCVPKDASFYQKLAGIAV